MNLAGAGHNSAPSTQPPKGTESLDLGDLTVVLSGIALTSREAAQLLGCLLAVSDSVACLSTTFAHFSIALAFPHLGFFLYSRCNHWPMYITSIIS